MIIAACLIPRDPILSASVIAETRSSQRIPKRIRNLLTAESGCNDGTAFPFLYAGLYALLADSVAEGTKKWFTDLLIWQCLFGIAVGSTLGLTANKLLRYSEVKGFVQESTLLVFYFLLAIFCVAVGSTLGLDDFLVCFSAGTSFCWDGWFSKRTARMTLPGILDLLHNSAFFVYFGSIIPWDLYHDNLSCWKDAGPCSPGSSLKTFTSDDCPEKTHSGSSHISRGHVHWPLRPNWGRIFIPCYRGKSKAGNWLITASPSPTRRLTAHCGSEDYLARRLLHSPMFHRYTWVFHRF